MTNFLLGRKTLSNKLLNFSSKKISLQRGEILFLDHFFDQKIAIVVDGIVNYNNSIQPSKELSLGCYSSGAILFLGNIFKECTNSLKEISSFNISASHNATIAFISIDTFDNIISKDSSLMYEITKYYSLFHEKNFYQLRDIQVFNTEDALLSMLVRAYNTYGKKIDKNYIVNKKIFNTNLAKCLDITEETVSRTISSLKKQGILDKKNGLFILYDLQGIKDRLGCAYCNEGLCYL
ncbi:MAG: Crp/Fnr family transcriptional regulator [Clostridium sp.]|uniref:Crp/Fnr family transcriptional regulator n=1 Tax=Clostridium sp. TaxID=1506 RepID=UPI003EE638C6